MFGISQGEQAATDDKIESHESTEQSFSNQNYVRVSLAVHKISTNKIPFEH